MIFASKDSAKTTKRIRPLVLVAGIAFAENRFPVQRTTGVFPCPPQVRPVTWSERMPAWSPNRIPPLPHLRPGLERLPGLLTPDADRLRVLLNNSLVRTLEGQPPLEAFAHPGFGESDPVELEDQLADQPTRPQLTGLCSVIGGNEG
ncbi:hypothetical protein GCM10009647_002590 [Streptomyces sanglieri]